jgi:tetratricopeptide (TPR) repeat protein
MIARHTCTKAAVRIAAALVWMAIASRSALADESPWETYRREGAEARQGRRYEEAERLLKLAVAEAEQFGAADTRLATSLRELGDVYFAQRKYDEAEPLFRRVVTVYETAQGSDHVDVAMALESLAMVVRVQRRYAEAVPLLERALAIQEKAGGPDDPIVAVFLSHLATCYQHLQKYDQAEVMLKRALEVTKKAGSPNEVVVANAMTNLAALYSVQKHYDQAEPLYQQALECYEKAAASKLRDMSTAKVLEKYAELLLATDRPAEALKLQERAEALRAATKGP